MSEKKVIYAIIEYIEGTPKIHSIYDYQFTAEYSFLRHVEDPNNEVECLNYKLFRKEVEDGISLDDLFNLALYLDGFEMARGWTMNKNIIIIKEKEL